MKKQSEKKARSVAHTIRLISIIAGSILLLLGIDGIMLKYYRDISKH